MIVLLLCLLLLLNPFFAHSQDQWIDGIQVWATSLIPSADDAYDLGSSTYQWKDLYVDGTAYLDAIDLNGTDIGSVYAPIGVNYLVGTADASLSAEIAVGTTPGGSLGGTWATPTIDDLFLKLGGDVATAGTYDFGEASVVLEIPNAAAPTTDATGEMAIDTDLITQGMLQVYLASAIANVVATTDTPGDNEVPTYDLAGGTVQWEAGGATGLWTDLTPNLEPNDDGDGIQINDSGGTDYVVQSHDGTDYNFVGTNTLQYTFDLPIESAGNINVSKADPEIRLTDTGDSEYSRITRADTSAKVIRYNRCNKPGALGKGLEFTGSDSQYVDFGNILDSIFDYDDSFSIGFWLYPDTFSTSEIFHKGTGAPTYMGIDIQCPDTSSTIYFHIIQAFSSKTLGVSNANIVSGSWQHLVCTYDGSNTAAGMKIYINGSESSTTIYDNTLDGSILNSYSLAVGAWNDGVRDWDGKVDELIIWDKELSEAEVIADYALGVGTYHTAGGNIQLLVHFDDEADPTADDSGNNYDGDLVASPTYLDGIITATGGDTEVLVWSSEDGTGGLEEGIQTFGDPDGRTVVDGKTVRFEVAGVEKARIDTTGIVIGNNSDADVTLTFNEDSDDNTLKWDNTRTDMVLSDDLILEDTHPSIWLRSTDYNIGWGWHYHPGTEYPLGLWRAVMDGTGAEVSPNKPAIWVEDDTTPSVTIPYGLVIPFGITPAPDREGALFLDTDASANGTLMCYSNGAWRAVQALP